MKMRYQKRFQNYQKGFSWLKKYQSWLKKYQPWLKKYQVALTIGVLAASLSVNYLAFSATPTSTSIGSNIIVQNQLGVGIDSPTGIFEVSHDGSSPDLSIDSTTGNIGIGTTAPGAKLEIADTSNPLVRISNGGGATPELRLELYRNSSAYGYVKYLPYGGPGGGLVLYDGRNDGNAKLIFSTYTGGEKMRITDSGNVGIGTTSPDTKLDVKGAITQRELSADPADPDPGNSVQWVSDGTGGGDAGDVMIKINVGGTTFVKTLVDYSSLFTCGDLFYYEGQWYSTVQIGSQCWFAENLNVGTRIDGTAESTDNGTIEKYCYGDVADNCDTDGGLYQWDEAMQYSTTSGAQGICPTGWHIPTDDEWTTLEIQICQDIGNGDLDACTATFSGTTGWRGQDTTDGHGEGSAMAGGCSNWSNNNLNNGGNCNNDFGVSGLDVLPAGYRSTDGSFSKRGSGADLWSSLESGTSAWRRYLRYDHTGVSRRTNDQAYGFAVRCLRD